MSVFHWKPCLYTHIWYCLLYFGSQLVDPSLHIYILSRVYSFVTDNNGFRIGWLDLLTASFALYHNKVQEPTINLQLNPSSLTAEDSLHSSSRSAIDFWSKSKLCYDRRSVGQSILVSSTHLLLKTRFFFLTVAGVLMWGALSDERTVVFCNVQCTLYLHFTTYYMNVILLI
jgi:hypothetical protein